MPHCFRRACAGTSARLFASVVCRGPTPFISRTPSDTQCAVRFATLSFDDFALPAAPVARRGAFNTEISVATAVLKLDALRQFGLLDERHALEGHIAMPPSFKRPDVKEPVPAAIC